MVASMSPVPSASISSSPSSSSSSSSSSPSSSALLCDRALFAFGSPSPSRLLSLAPGRQPCVRVRALVVDPSDSGVNDFTARMEKAWLISKQPRPVVCVSCNSEGSTECQWCRGTGFFILGDNMLCQVPSRNTKCLICLGQGIVHCKDCKGTGYIAKWLCNPSSNNKGS